jgi:hypothetical protein
VVEAHLILAGLIALLGLTEQAAARLDALRSGFGDHPKEVSMAELERLVEEAPDAPAAGPALIWLGDLTAQTGDAAGAERSYVRAYETTRDAAVRRLAARGLGDCALAGRRFAAARSRFAEARAGASPVLAEELRQKEARAALLLARSRAEWAAWTILAAAIVMLARAVRRARAPLHAPTELWFVLPIYALFVAGAAGRDPGAITALALCGAGSIVLITLFSLASTGADRAAKTRGLVAVGAANLALFYGALNHAGLIDRLLDAVAL